MVFLCDEGYMDDCCIHNIFISQNDNCQQANEQFGPIE
jgi:hypothetical protein